MGSDAQAGELFGGAVIPVVCGLSEQVSSAVTFVSCPLPFWGEGAVVDGDG